MDIYKSTIDDKENFIKLRVSLFKELDPKHQEELLIQITALVRFLHTKNMAPQVSQFLFR